MKSMVGRAGEQVNADLCFGLLEDFPKTKHYHREGSRRSSAKLAKVRRNSNLSDPSPQDFWSAGMT